MIQSEAQLEESLIQRLIGLGYERVVIRDSKDLKANLKLQLEQHNHLQLSDPEFSRVMNHLDKGNVFERAKILRGSMRIDRDDGSSVWIKFLDTENWCQNRFQVTQQVTQEGSYKNRYDVTLLINGLPLVQVELKRRGMELKEAFNQINRYQRHSYWSDNGLFQYVQLFVISNGMNTKYYANNRKQDFKQTFFWAKEDNSLITHLDEFTDIFLEKCHVSKMICKHIVLHESDKVLMVLRPYQFYAAEAIVKQVENSNKFGYIWHTTGSGKTLTSFKTAQLLTELPTVHKVLFVVDRADLDYQTTREFNFFSEGSVDGTDNTSSLVKQMAGDHKLIVTTIQKLNRAISSTRHETAMEDLKDKRMVFIFDECHRSQFGQTHTNIKKFFSNVQMFGFTGTPIFVDNAIALGETKRTTKDLFGECLHRYVITNAIADQNVLKFSVEYWGKLKRKDGTLIDEKVPSINTKEFFDNPERLEQIADWIIANHNLKTRNREFSSIFCVSSVDTLIEYYEMFKRKKEAGEHDLRVITIFTYAANEEDSDANGLIAEPDFDLKPDTASKHSRDKMNTFIADYNAMYNTKHSAKDSQAFYNYYKDIAKRIKERDREGFADSDRADILLVVNMFLTGFDAKKLNTLYVDKNLKYHGLIQAFSRTNRPLGTVKSQGNIVVFRNLKDKTDEAIRLFSDPNAKEDILLEPYNHYVTSFNDELEKLKSLANEPKAVDKLISEDDKLEFVQSFRAMIRSLNVLKSFTEFEFNDLDLPEQTFEDFKSKYLDLYEQTRKGPEGPGASIIKDVDFELELIGRDDINVAYILQLLADLQKTKPGDSAKQGDYEEKKKTILDTIEKETKLRSKRQLIETFINNYLPNLPQDQPLNEAFSGYWNDQRREALKELAQQENMDETSLYQMISDYHFSGKEPLRETVLNALKDKPKILERKSIFERVVGRMLEAVKMFDEDMGNV